MSKLDRMLFIYARNGMVKVLTRDEASDAQDHLADGGWKHTATVEPQAYITALLNGEFEWENLIREARGITVQ